MLWVQAWPCVLCVCSSFTWRRGSVSHWCAGSLIQSSCCYSSSAPSGRESSTQSDCTLHRKKQINCVNSNLEISLWANTTPLVYRVDKCKVKVILKEEVKMVIESCCAVLQEIVRNLCQLELQWAEWMVERFSESLGWLMTPGTDGLSQICLTHPAMSHVR